MALGIRRSRSGGVYTGFVVPVEEGHIDHAICIDEVRLDPLLPSVLEIVHELWLC